MAYSKWMVLPAVTLVLAAACGSKQHGFSGAVGSDGGIVTPNPDGGPPIIVNNQDSGTIILGNNDGGGAPSCAMAQFVAQQAPAAMLFILDDSDEMAGSKWTDAQQAIQQAMDQSAFNTMYLGLLTEPDDVPEDAMCSTLSELGIQVYCEVAPNPQVSLQLAGSNLSTGSSGVRHDIFNYIQMATPNSTGALGNSNPLYDALNNGITALQSLSLNGKRMIFLITAGAASCTSQDSPQRSAYMDDTGCMDWEDPDNIVTLLKTAHDSTTAPVNTFIVGVQGADTAPSGDGSTAPYYVSRAMSAYALAGSPETVPSGCDGTYSQSGTNPTTPCDFDLSSTPSFATALATDIGQIRNTLLGCDFNLPASDNGAPIDMSKVNVTYTIGSSTTTIDRRSNASDMCTTGGGCWDYTTSGQVELIGAACSAVETSAAATVNIVVGCATLLK